MAQKIQRGAIIRKNDNGTLEWVDGSRTYIGSATLPDGKVITKRFRRNGFDEEEVAERWIKWQCKSIDKEETEEKEATMANETKKNPCPFSSDECAPACAMFSEANQTCSLKLGMLGLWNMGCNIMNLKVDEEVEMVAMAIGELGSTVTKAAASLPIAAPETVQNPAPEPEPVKELTVADGFNAFFEGKNFINFVNLHSNAVFGKYKKFCTDLGFPMGAKKEMVEEVCKRYLEIKVVGKTGGAVFEAA